MSRRNPQTTPEPSTTTIIDDVIQSEQIIKDIPLSTLHGHDLKKIKSFKKLRQSYKISNQKSVFITDMNSMLKHMSIDENKLNLVLLVEVCNIANEFFIYGTKTLRESTKIESIHELLLPYFMNDVTVLETMIQSVQHKITKSTILRRTWKRLKNYFF